MKNRATAIVFGRSPFINEIREYVPRLCEKFYSVGCNYFVDSFPCVKTVAFYDNISPTVRPTHRIITRNKNAQSEIIKNNPMAYVYEVVNNCESFSEDKGILHFHFHTPTIVLNWLYLHGYENVVLAGIDLGIGTGHFDCPTVPKWQEQEVLQARRHLETVCTKYLNLYQLNPNSPLNLDTISIEELL